MTTLLAASTLGAIWYRIYLVYLLIFYAGLQMISFLQQELYLFYVIISFIVQFDI